MKIKYDAVVIGGSLGGIMAAYALSKEGIKTALVEQYHWIGGQLTSQGVPSDEHDFIEFTGATKTYRDFRENIRSYYRNHPDIIDELKIKDIFNPGNGWVSKNSSDPRISLHFLEKLLEPFIESGILTLYKDTTLLGSETNHNTVYNVLLKKDNKEFILEAKYFLDATDTGELLPLTNTKYVTGAESFDETGEPHAPKEAKPFDMQPITWTAAVGFDPDNKTKMEKPALYDYFKNYIMPFNESILSWYAAGLDQGSKREFSMFGEKPYEHTPAMFTYRQVIEKNHFKKGVNASVMLINWPQNDYILGNIYDDKNALYHQYKAKQLTLSLVYWLQNEARRDDGNGIGYHEIFLVPDVLGTKDGLAMAPYIRESRRIKALYTIKEQDISKRYAKTAPNFKDSIGIGHYHIDLHMTTETKTYFFDETYPFQIPLGALIPIETNNLIAACKNIGTTHVTNGCYRLHPVEWNIGESAGYLVAYCLKNNTTPKAVYENDSLLKDYQALLIKQGILLQWPESVLGK
ncbi:FAD-dependent oxidoreductase [Acholeplasma granularum]|uniref:FAD-dependent oxidoreductase n=1 Tax=Acholeplasma granularum TaxID=264635 RepID=UPI0004B59015|nr:FAD-dependent oxidoreductase [Acholeplasma granularum]